MPLLHRLRRGGELRRLARVGWDHLLRVWLCLQLWLLDLHLQLQGMLREVRNIGAFGSFKLRRLMNGL